MSPRGLSRIQGCAIGITAFVVVLFLASQAGTALLGVMIPILMGMAVVLAGAASVRNRSAARCRNRRARVAWAMIAFWGPLAVWMAIVFIAVIVEGRWGGSD